MIGYGNSYFISTILDTESGVPPVNTAAPAITGTAQEGQTVTCSTGTWTGTPTITYTYQWKRNGSNIGSATNSTYTLVTADVSQSITCQVTATNGSGSASATSNTITPIAAVDPDAQAFITAAAITDPTQQAAINTLVVDLKGYSIWSKMKALYPMVGGTASTHKFNLKNPLDTDAAFRLVFNGGWTHSANGAQPNGTNGFANTYFAPNTGILNSNSIGYYTRTVNSSGATDPVNMGGFNSSSSASTLISNASTVSGRLNGTVISGSITGGTGLISISKTSSTVTNVYKNGTSVSSGNSGGTLASSVIYLGTTNILGVTYASGYVNNQFAFVYISDGLSGAEASNFYTTVQAFQTALSRNI
jgi:hypothetical protein